MLLRLLEPQQLGKDVSVEIALVYHGLGDNEQAFAALERAASEHSSQFQNVIENPRWKDLRRHPRFLAILRRMNLAT